MNTIKLTYKVIAKNNPFAQKTITRTVSNNNNAFNEFESKVNECFKDDNCEIEYNHAGKNIIVTW